MRPTEIADRVADVLDALVAADHGLSVTELASRTGVHKSTASRLLATLAQRGLVTRDSADGRYHLGLSLVHLGSAALGSVEVVRVGHSVIEDVMERGSEAAYLAVPDQGGVLYVDQCTPRRAIVASNWTGRRGHLHCSSSGKVFAAFGAIADIDSALTPPLPRMARRTITDPAQFHRLLARVRRQGYATSVDEFEDGLTSVSAPVLGSEGRAVASLGIAGPTSRLRPPVLSHLAALAAEGAALVARRLTVAGSPPVR